MLMLEKNKSMTQENNTEIREERESKDAERLEF